MLQFFTKIRPCFLKNLCVMYIESKKNTESFAYPSLSREVDLIAGHSPDRADYLNTNKKRGNFFIDNIALILIIDNKSQGCKNSKKIEDCMKIKYLALTTPLLLSGCSITDSLLDSILDLVYPLLAISPESVCEGSHYHSLDGKTENIEHDNFRFYFLLTSDDSHSSDLAFGRYSKIMGAKAFSPTRYPAVNQEEWVSGAIWGIALSDMGVTYNKEVIDASYKEFIHGAHKSDFDKILSVNGYSSRLFREILDSEDYGLRISKIGNSIYQLGIQSVPAIVVNDNYVIYPMDFEDRRDAWMTAHYILDENPDLSAKCLISK